MYLLLLIIEGGRLLVSLDGPFAAEIHPSMTHVTEAAILLACDSCHPRNMSSWGKKQIR